MAKIAEQEAPVITHCPDDKAEGALVGLAAGDALGWPQELRSRAIKGPETPSPKTSFRDWIRRSGGRFYPHEEIIGAGEYSDDTQLTMAVGRSRLCPGQSWWAALTRFEIPLWTLYERGGGGATKRAADHWVKGVQPWKSSDARAVRQYFAAGGNGVAMRILPHSLFLAGSEGPAQLMRDVIMDAVATHGHPRAIVGATAYAYAAWWLLRIDRTLLFGELINELITNAPVWGELPVSSQPKNGWREVADEMTDGGYTTLWTKIVDEMVALLKIAARGIDAGAIADDDKVLEEVGCFGRTKGAGTISAAAAIYLCARYAAQPAHGVVKAAFANGADTDTLAGMTGGLMGCLAGREWLPSEWLTVQDCDYLRRLARRLAQGPSSVDERVSDIQAVGKKELEALRSAAERPGVELDLGAGTRVRVVNSVVLKPLSKRITARRGQLRTAEGQTLYVTNLGRMPKEKPDNRSTAAQNWRIRQDTLFSEERSESQVRAAGVKLTVRDLARAAKFYEDVLGLVPLKRTRRFTTYGAISLVDIRAAVELSGGIVRLEESDCHNRVELHVNDLEELWRRLAEWQGSPPRITTMPWGERSMHLLDPDGNLVEVVEKRRVSEGARDQR